MKEPASSIIDKCGGVGTVAEALSIPPASIYRWRRPKDKNRNGTGGLVPNRHHQELLRLFPQLEPSDFFLPDGHADSTKNVTNQGGICGSRNRSTEKPAIGENPQPTDAKRETGEAA